MPTASDLVTDLPADFETFGQAVATSMADLLGGTTGQILAKASNTDMDFTWIANDQGDITGVTASSPLTGGGTSGAITLGILSGTTSNLGAVQLSDSTSSTSTTLAATANAVKTTYDLANGAIPKNLIDAAGDLIIGTADNTAGRLAIGANATVLTSNGTTASWAAPAGGGGMTLLSTTTLSGASTTISSISGSYKQLVAYIYGVNGTSTGFEMTIEPNGTAGICTGVYMMNANSAASVNPRTATSISISSLSKNTTNNATTLVIDNYASSTNYKPFQYYGFVENSGGANVQACELAGAIVSNTAISSLKFNCLVAGTFNAGTVELYGVK